MGRLQMRGQLLRATLRMLDRLDQNGDGFGRRRQPGGGGTAQSYLAGGNGRVAGQIEVMALMFLSLQIGMLMELPEKGARVQTQALAQLGGGESAGGLANQGRDGLRQMAVAGKADVAMKPKPVSIEPGQIGQGVKAAIVIEAGQGAPSFETPPQGTHRRGQILHEFGQGDYLFAPPTPEQRAGLIRDRFHKGSEISINGTVYANKLLIHIVCHNEEGNAKEKPNDLLEIKETTSPNLDLH
jgi:hypothetical protein